MKRFFYLVLIAILSPAIHAGDPDQQTNAQDAKAAIKAFAGALQAELKSAMQTGGPVAAIGICNTRAMPIGDLVSEEKGMELSRVSLKNRNPDNGPNDWQRDILVQFEAWKAEGKDIGSLVWSKTVETDQGKEFRLMKAIPTGGVCLACHGKAIAPEVSEALAKLYPEDKATGFKEGDIRGAFVVTRKLSD